MVDFKISYMTTTGVDCYARGPPRLSIQEVQQAVKTFATSCTHSATAIRTWKSNQPTDELAQARRRWRGEGDPLRRRGAKRSWAKLKK